MPAAMNLERGAGTAFFAQGIESFSNDIDRVDAAFKRPTVTSDLFEWLREHQLQRLVSEIFLLRAGNNAKQDDLLLLMAAASELGADDFVSTRVRERHPGLAQHPLHAFPAQLRQRHFSGLDAMQHAKILAELIAAVLPPWRIELTLKQGLIQKKQMRGPRFANLVNKSLPTLLDQQAWHDLRQRIVFDNQGFMMGKVAQYQAIQDQPWRLRELFSRLESRGYKASEQLLKMIQESNLSREEWKVIDSTIRTRISETESLGWWGGKL